MTAEPEALAELQRPVEGRLGERLLGAEQVHRRERPGALRVGPVLDPDAAPGQRVGEAGDVADREDPAYAGLEGGVDQHAVVDLEAGGLGQLRTRLDADPDDEQVARDGLPSSSCSA